MTDLKVIEDAATSIMGSAVRLRDLVAALQAQVDPTAQARVDAVGVVLTGAASILAGIQPTTSTEEPPPPPPTGPTG